MFNNDQIRGMRPFFNQFAGFARPPQMYPRPDIQNPGILGCRPPVTNQPQPSSQQSAAYYQQPYVGTPQMPTLMNTYQQKPMNALLPSQQQPFQNVFVAMPGAQYYQNPHLAPLLQTPPNIQSHSFVAQNVPSVRPPLLQQPLQNTAGHQAITSIANTAPSAHSPVTLQAKPQPPPPLPASQQQAATGDFTWMLHLNPEQKSLLENLKRQLDDFEVIFNNWDKEFEVWREKNANHPDINSYMAYAQQWQQWKSQLLTRRELNKQMYSQTIQQLKEQVQQTLSRQNQITAVSSVPLPPLPPQMQPLPPPPPVPPPPPPPPPPSEPPPPPPPQETNSSKLVIAEDFSKDDVSYIDLSGDTDDRLENDYNRFIKETTEFSNQLAEKKQLEEKEKAAADTDTDDRVEVKPNSSSSQAAVESINIVHQPIDPSILDNDVFRNARKTLLYLRKKYTLLKVMDSLDEKHNVNKSVPKETSESASTNKPENMLLSSDNEDDSEVKALSDEIILPGSKPFDLHGAISKMKAIKPPENTTLLPTPPALPNSTLPNVLSGVCPRPLFPSTVSQMTLPQNYFPHTSQNSNVNSDKLSSRPHQQSMSNSDLSNQPNVANLEPPQRYPDESYEDFRHREEMFRKSSPFIAKTIDYGHRRQTNVEMNNANVRHSRNISEKNSLYSRPQYHRPNEPNFQYEKGNMDARNSNIEAKNETEVEQQICPVEPQVLTYKEKRYFIDPPSGVVSIDDLLNPPSRDFRPKNMVIILRGLPGSGKTYFAKLVKDKEVENGGSAPRILSLDDYFMVEKENTNKDEDMRRGTVSKGLEYEYDRKMEESYRIMLLKAFKKTVDNGYFQIIIIDAINEQLSNYEEAYNYAIKRGFVVYIAEMDCIDPVTCQKRNIHNRTLEEITGYMRRWQQTPENIVKLDTRCLLQNMAIENVDMESVPNEKRQSEPEEDHSTSSSLIADVIISKIEDDEEDEFGENRRRSRWEKMEESGDKLDRLDAYKMKRKITMDEYLQLPEDYEQRSFVRGKKRVRWADVEERKNQEHMRRVGFVVGQNWDRVMDPQHPDRALTKTKYF